MRLILVLCAAGFLAVAEGQGCPAGEGFVNSKSCSPCAPGSYNDGSTSSVFCTRCPDGFTSSETGATDSSGCTQCREGYMRDADSGDCVACPQGTYSDTVDAASCTSCPEGTNTPREGAYAANLCFACDPGTSFIEPFRKCVECWKGQYSDGTISGPCSYCPQGYSTAGNGATSVEECTECSFGYGKEEDSCVPCPIGSFGNYKEQKCETCPAGTQTTAPAKSSCSCLPGHFRYGFSGECNPCPIGTYRGFYTYQCLPCPEGQTTAAEGQADSSACVDE